MSTAEQVQALKDAGNKEFMAGNHQKAVDLFTEAITLDSQNHILFSNRSGAYAGLKDFKKALDDANQTVAIKPDWPKGWSRKGAAHWGCNQLEDAENAFKRGLQLEPGNAAMQESLSDVQEAIKRAKEGDQPANVNPMNAFHQMLNAPDLMAKLVMNPTTNQYLKQPDFVTKFKQLQANPEMLQILLQTDPRFQQVLGVMLGANFTSGPPEEEDGQPLPPKKPEPKKEPPKPEAPKLTEKQIQFNAEKDAGNAAYRSKDFEGALAHYNKALEIDAEQPTILLNIASVHLESGHYDEGLDTCDKALELAKATRSGYEMFAKCMTRKGNIMVKQGRLEDAIDIYKKALLEHRNPDTLKRLTDTEKAKKIRDEQAYIDPVKAAEAKEQGNEFFKAHNFPEAVKSYTESIKRNPHDHVPFSNRAAAYLKLGAVQEALRDTEECIRLAPDFIRGHIRKGQAQFLMKEYHKAMETYNRALQIDETNAEAREGLEKTMRAIQMGSSGQADEERVAHAMADPEIRNMLEDPTMRKVLQDLQTDAKAAREHMANPVIRARIDKLIAAGVLRTG